MAQTSWVGSVKLIGNFRHLHIGISRFLEMTGTNQSPSGAAPVTGRTEISMYFFIRKGCGLRYLGKSSNHFHMQHKLTGFYNQEAVFTERYGLNL